MLGSGELGKEVVIELQRLGIEVIALDSYANAPAMRELRKQRHRAKQEMRTLVRSERFDATAVDQALNLGVAIDRLGLEVAAEFGFRVEIEDRRVKLTPVFNENGFVIGDELGE